MSPIPQRIICRGLPDWAGARPGPRSVADLPACAAPPLRRPKLLVSAARHGLADYNRSRDLPRILQQHRIPTGALAALQNVEAAMEDRRLAGDPGYSCLRHVDLLIALMAEMRIVL